MRLELAILEHHPSLTGPTATATPTASGTSTPAAAKDEQPLPAPPLPGHLPDGTRPTPAMLPLPAGIPSRRHDFVGRVDELAWLRSQWELAAGGAKRMTVLDGEPGIGKTRLAMKLAEQVHAEGAMVLWGRSSPEQLTPYQPVIEALREVITALQRAGRRVILGAHEGLRLLLPELVGIPEDRPVNATAERFRLFEAVAALVHAQSQIRPVLFVVDDLHWADPATAALLLHVLRHPEPGSLLILGTARNVDAGDTRHFADAVADLRRDHLVERLAVRGLDVDAATELARQAGGALAAQRVGELHRAAAGNPFFIEELSAHLVECSDEPTGVPASVREVVDRRLARLAGDTVEVLSAASVLGDEFDVDVLEAVTGRHDEILDIVDVARDAGLVDESAESLGRYSFVHALVRQTLLDRLSRTRRARLHLAAAQALEAASTRFAGHLPEIANHRLAALPVGDAEAAVLAAVRAGNQALDTLAYEDGLELAERAAATLAASGLEQPELAAEVALLRSASARTVGRLVDAQSFVDEAAALARAHGLPNVLSRAGLAAAAAKAAGIGFEFGAVDQPLAQLFEEALAVETEEPRRIRLLSALAITLYCDPDRSRSERLSSEAVTLAEARGEPALQAAALLARATSLWTASTMDDRATTLVQAAELAATAADADLEVRARIGLISSLTELGQVAAAEDEIDRLAKVVARIGQPAYQPYPTSCTVLFQLLRGEYAVAAETTEHVHATTSTLYAINARDSYDARRFALARDLRGLRGLVPYFQDIGEEVVAVRRLTAAMVLAHGGSAGAGEHYEKVIDLPLPDDALWVSAMAVKCELVRFFGDAARAEAAGRSTGPLRGPPGLQRHRHEHRWRLPLPRPGGPHRGPSGRGRGLVRAGRRRARGVGGPPLAGPDLGRSRRAGGRTGWPAGRRQGR